LFICTKAKLKIAIKINDISESSFPFKPSYEIKNKKYKSGKEKIVITMFCIRIVKYCLYFILKYTNNKIVKQIVITNISNGIISLSPDLFTG
jgi:hypothetical protein